WEACKNLVTARGPDRVTEKFENLTPIWSGHFVAAVLWTQGSDLCEQPAVDSAGNILLWNGDIFSGNLAKAEDDRRCDTNALSSALQSSSNVPSVFREIQGPYSFVYFQKSTNLLYFGRDIVGRHSLLLKANSDENTLTLTSVASKEVNEIVEIPAIGIFVVNLDDSRVNLACHPWKEPDSRFTDVVESLETHSGVDIDIRETIWRSDASARRLHSGPDVGDSDRLENSPYSGNSRKTLEYLLEDKDTAERVDRLLRLLRKAVEVRTKKQPKFCKTCIEFVLRDGKEVACDHSKIGISFSGGLDSAILALIADKYASQYEPIDLINVAFEKSGNARNDKSKKSKESNNEKESTDDPYDDVPDRKTGKQTFLELSKIRPKRKWNFVEVNISRAELQEYRSSRICNLLHPLRTVLDESLGCAVWFASRAKGTIRSSANTYESPCRSLLLGTGADELFGGYTRHRTTLRHKGWDALTQELNLEMARISERNLGRDDRIVSDHGRQSRLPYLDENVIEYVQRLKPWERCYPTDKMPSGLGDKLLLRLAAYKLGLRDTANFPKRAFQFGSRIANGKENARDISGRL
ncbi:unnamed protein product, partial [Heterotrigona itama]